MISLGHIWEKSNSLFWLYRAKPCSIESVGQTVPCFGSSRLNSFSIAGGETSKLFGQGTFMIIIAPERILWAGVYE